MKGRPSGSKNLPKNLAKQLELEALQTLKSLATTRRVLHKSLEALQKALDNSPELVQSKDHIDATLACTMGLSRCLSDIVRAIKFLRDTDSVSEEEAGDATTAEILKSLKL